LIVKVQPTPKTDAETAKEQQKEQDEASAKWWTIGLAVITALVGFLQVVLVSLQAYIASQQNKIIEGQTTILQGQETSMKDGLAIAREQTEIARRQNEIITTQTTHMAEGLQVARDSATASRISADAAKEASDTSALALRMAHRPKLIVQLKVPDDLINPDRILDSELTVTNVGPFDLNLNFEFSDWFILEDLPFVNPITYVDSTGISGVLKPGAFTRLTVKGRTITLDEWILLNHTAANVAVGPEGRKLYLIGAVKYTDPVGFRRKYFCFQYQIAKGLFIRPKRPGYNYTG
jgi:hypothetical protein